MFIYDHSMLKQEDYLTLLQDWGEESNYLIVPVF
jgi:hypothetical protein